MSAPAELPPARGDTRGVFGWRVNRLSDRLTGLEIAGTVSGFLIALFFLVGAGYLLFYGRPEPWMVAAPIAGAILIGGISSLSSGQFLYRAWLRKKLAAIGLPTTATVIDRWRLRSDNGAWSCIKFRFTTAAGPIERVAIDSTEIVRHIKIGDTIPLRYDPDDPRRLLIEAFT